MNHQILVIAVYVSNDGWPKAQFTFDCSPEAFEHEIRESYQGNPWQPGEIVMHQSSIMPNEEVSIPRLVGILSDLDEISGSQESPWNDLVERIIGIGAHLGNRLR